MLAEMTGVIINDLCTALERVFVEFRMMAVETVEFHTWQIGTAHSNFRSA